jgi:hypothetical protein
MRRIIFGAEDELFAASAMGTWDKAEEKIMEGIYLGSRNLA